MIEAVTLLENLTRRGVRLTPKPPKLIAEPSSLLTDADRAAIRAHKPRLLALLAVPPQADTKPAPIPSANDPASQALGILARLKGYTLPEGRMPAARTIARRLRPLLTLRELDPAAALAALQATEAEFDGAGRSL
jgi:hypothetical protein